MTDKLGTHTYIGRRIQKGKLQHCFLDHEDVLCWFPKARASTFAGARIGTIYALGERFPTVWSSVAVGQVDEEKRMLWQTQDRAAYQVKNERAGSASPDLDAAVEAIRDARKQMPRAHATAFDAWLLNKIR